MVDVGHLSAVGRRPRRRSSRRTRRTACSRAGRASAWTPRWSATTPWRPAACWSRKIGGPSVKPYQPDGVWEAVAMPASNTHDYKHDTARSLYRRSMYTFWKRSAPAGLDGHLQRSEPRDLHRPPRADQHAAAGPGDAERPAVRRGGPAPGPDGPQGRRQTARRSASISSPGGCWPGRSAPRSSAIVQAALARLERLLPGAPRRRRKLIAVGESKADPTLDPPTLAAWTMLANELMNLDEVLNK